MPTSRSAPRLAAALATLVLATACADRGSAVFPVTDPAPAPPNAAALVCTANVRAGTLACERARPPAGVRGVILGGQGINVRLRSSGTTYDPATQTLRSDVTVQNLTAQPLGTTSGYTASTPGVRVFFAAGPVVVSGSGTVEVQNPDGTDAFTAGVQPYFEYTGVLLPGDTSAAHEWRFSVPLSANAFVFTVYVAAPVPSEDGWVALSPVAPSLVVGDTMRLATTVRTATGRLAADQAVSWTTSDSAVATVDTAGVVTGTGPGSAVVKAASGARTGQVTVVVRADSASRVPTVVSLSLSPPRTAANGADTIWAEAHARSPHGVGYMYFGIGVAFGSQAECYANLVGGTPDDGVFRCAIVLPEGVNPGVWVLHTVFASDLDGHLRDLNLPEMRAAGALAEVSVGSPAQDVTPPVLTGLSFFPDTARAGVDTVTVDVSFTDAGVGVSQATTIFVSDAGGNQAHGCGTNGLASGTRRAGTIRCSFPVRADAPLGVWRVAYVELIDANGNVGYTYRSQLTAAGYPTTFVSVPPGSP